LINERQIESNPYLKARGESQLHAKHAFERAAGWRFGLMVGVLIVGIGYVFDAAALAGMRAEFWWVKLLLAGFTILPLAILVGGVGGYFNWLVKLPLWMLFGIVAGYCAIHIPFDGARLALQWFDPNLRVVEYLPMPAAAADSFGMLATLGAFLGLIVGLLQSVLVNWAWERSTDDNRLTLQGAALFLLILPLAFAFAVLFDGTANQPLRSPMALIQSVIQSGLYDKPDQQVGESEVHRALVYLNGQRWRTHFTPDYTVRLASSEPSQVGESFVDASFSNGFNWRCRVTTYGEFTGSCYDLNTEYSRYISEFVPRGSFRCTDCEMRIGAGAAAWRGQHAHTLAPDDQFTVKHGAGSTMNVRVQSADGTAFECLVWGTNPVTIETCK
jgi:hypothetical protein